MTSTSRGGLCLSERSALSAGCGAGGRAAAGASASIPGILAATRWLCLAPAGRLAWTGLLACVRGSGPAPRRQVAELAAPLAAGPPRLGGDAIRYLLQLAALQLDGRGPGQPRAPARPWRLHGQRTCVHLCAAGWSGGHGL